MKLISESHITKTLTFRFNEDIEKVHRCFDDIETLEKNGISENLFNLTVQTECNCKTYNLKLKNNPHISTLTIRYNYNEEGNTLKLLIVKINDTSLSSSFIVKISFYQNIEENSTMTIFELEYSTSDAFLTSFIDSIKLLSIEYCKKVQHFLTHSAKCTIHNESILIFRPLNLINDKVQNFRELLKIISQKRRIEQKGKNGEIGTSYTMINQNKLISTKYTLRNITIREGKVSYRVEKEILGERRKKMFLNFNVIQLSPISCYFSIESEIAFYIDGKYLAYLAQYHQMLLKKVKKEFESHFLI